MSDTLNPGRPPRAAARNAEVTAAEYKARRNTYERPTLNQFLYYLTLNVVMAVVIDLLDYHSLGYTNAVLMILTGVAIPVVGFASQLAFVYYQYSHGHKITPDIGYAFNLNGREPNWHYFGVLAFSVLGVLTTYDAVGFNFNRIFFGTCFLVLASSATILAAIITGEQAHRTNLARTTRN